MDENKKELPYRVFARHDNGMYAMRFTLPGHAQIRIGLGTRDKAKADELAVPKYMEAEIRARSGLLLGVASFDKIATTYLADLEGAARKEPSKLKGCRYAKGVIERYLIPFFGRRNITAIRYQDLVEYLNWRRTYWTEGDGKNARWIWFERGHKNLKRKAPDTEASASTLKRESSIIRGVFMQGVRKGFLKASDVPKIDVGRVEAKQRPAFTKEQYDHLISVAQSRIADAANLKVQYERHVLFNYIIFAVHSGLRTMEMRNLNWRHIENFYMLMEDQPQDLGDVGVWAFGKGLPPRRLVPRRMAVIALEGLFFAYRRQFGRDPVTTDPVFCNYKGERITNFSNSLKALLKAADLLTAADGSSFTAYCFRHTYATWALQRDPPVDVYTLANNMRTSVEMIQKWYGKSTSADQARILRGDDELDIDIEILNVVKALAK